MLVKQEIFRVNVLRIAIARSHKDLEDECSLKRRNELA